MSLPEVLLWKQLRNNGIGFRVRRQHPIDAYVLDFFIEEAFLCVEVDGAQHEYSVAKDEKRDDTLDTIGIQTVRFSASAVLQNPRSVAKAIHFMVCEKLEREPWLFFE